ncbi:hypothetical protein DB30_04723 [Enhygromyxa salina]|uniref:Uncharacterized protein n=1 Tax=Enhygromyxa salina TaxID=215803 RepID=A0A0C1ZYH4_9BACT|nr:hypothetical protein [Enhygromyxa salina]KIG16263.1 hypothetical protein DB30_04723 [Enhygromyxa salina]
MTYNFTDNPTPILNSIVDATGAVGLKEGSPQGDLITPNFTGSSVSVSIQPPEGWSLDDVVWTTGGTGTFGLPEPGQEHSHEFRYTVSQNGTSQTHAGSFKIKKDGTAPPPP